MAPDINSMPSSPRLDRPSSSRSSHQMPPPPAPASAPAPSASASTQTAPPAPRSPIMTNNEPAGLPLRHPRPMTAAELYLECEKEQEAVVNRLTRELTALRAQSASVASNASHSSNSTSASLLPIDISDPNPTHQMTGPTHPTPSRRHRSSSSLSARSNPSSTAASVPTNTSTQAQAGSTTSNIPTHGVSQASADRAAARGGLSRQPSITTNSGTSTPARQSLDNPRHSLQLPHRPSLSRDASYVSTAAQAGTPTAPLSPPMGPPGVVTTQNFADTAAYRSEMEIVKAENEALRQRVRALERALRSRRRDSSNSDAGARLPRDTSAISPTLGSPAPSHPPTVAAWAAGNSGGIGGVAPPRERSESQSTTASSRRGLPNEGEREDIVRLGESAGSFGVGPRREQS